MAIDVEMCMMVQELRVRERQLAEKARDIKASTRTYMPDYMNDMLIGSRH